MENLIKNILLIGSLGSSLLCSTLSFAMFSDLPNLSDSDSNLMESDISDSDDSDSVISDSSDARLDVLQRIPIVRQLNYHQWQLALERFRVTLIERPHLRQIVVATQKSLDGRVPEWTWVLKRNRDGSFSEVTYRRNVEVLRHRHFEIR